MSGAIDYVLKRFPTAQRIDTIAGEEHDTFYLLNPDLDEWRAFLPPRVHQEAG